MGAALVGGLITDGFPAVNLRVTDTDQTKLDRVGALYPVQITTDNTQATAGADVVVLAVKPQAIRSVACGLADTIASHRPLVVSVAAGIRCRDLGKWLGADCAVIRVMPNTPALVGSGAAALYANEHVSSDQREIAESIMRAVGLTVWLENERDMDAVTAVSGSGPAYFFLIMEVMEQAATQLGLPVEKARLLILQTAFGAAKMALESGADPAALRANVTSPGGTTEQALQILQENNLDGIFLEALSAAKDRSIELAQTFGDP